MMRTRRRVNYYPSGIMAASMIKQDRLKAKDCVDVFLNMTFFTSLMRNGVAGAGNHPVVGAGQTHRGIRHFGVDPGVHVLRRRPGEEKTVANC